MGFSHSVTRKFPYLWQKTIVKDQCFHRTFLHKSQWTSTGNKTFCTGKPSHMWGIIISYITNSITTHQGFPRVKQAFKPFPGSNHTCMVYIYGKHAASLFCPKCRIKLCVADTPFLGKRDKTSHVNFAMITQGCFSLEALLAPSIKAIIVSHIAYMALVGTKYALRLFYYYNLDFLFSYQNWNYKIVR